MRVEKHAANAQKIAEYLRSETAIDQLYYPGISSHPNHEIAKKQQSAFGSVISFSLCDNTIEAAEAFVGSTQLFKLAESLGGVKSLICHPAQMTHKSVPAASRKASGVSDSLIRLSVGLEDAGDLIHDLKQAFSLAAYKQERALTNA